MISPGNRYRLMRAAFGTLFALWGVAALAQQPGFSNRNNALGTGYNEQNQIQYGAPSGTIDNNAPQQKADSTKKPKIRKPLESYFFDDSTRARSIFVWHPDLKYNEVKQSTIDTLIDGFQTDYPYQRLRGGIGSAYLGNLGGASIPLDAALRPDYRNFSFAQILDAYLVTPDRANFYNTKKPFTHLSYFFGGQKKRLEESLWATHAQQISPSTGMNIDYKSRGTRGTYTNQGARDKNLSLGFSHTGKKYSIHAGYIYNMASLKENGGILRDGDITDTVFDMPEVIDVYLTDAKNEYKNNVFYLTQSYGMPLRRLSDEDFSIAERSSVFIGHSFLYSRFWRKYTDTKSGMAKGEDVKPYYEHWYINPTASRDSTFESLLSNKVFVQLQPWDRNGVVGVINADTQLQLPDFRAHERTFDLIEQVAGRAGRAQLPGRVLVQTYEADAAPIRAAARYDRALFLRDELPKRKMLGYPPYVRMANVLVWGAHEADVAALARELAVELAEQARAFGGDGWSVLPATPCVLAKLRNTYRWHVVVKCPADADVSAVLLPVFRRRKADKWVNVAVDVDPDDLL